MISPPSTTHASLADGRELIFFDENDHRDRMLIDPRGLPKVTPAKRGLTSF